MLAIVTVSYRQTIKAYPQGASSYIVASDNLGSRMGVLAAAALLIGYVVTVAVSVSAGVAALTSILPGIYDQRVIISILLVALLMLGNLRGIRESGTIFMIPTYAYIVVMLAIIGYGVVQTALGNVPDFVPPPSWEVVEDTGQVLGIFLILRAFSQGAVALTGVEAVSDGVPAFKPPEWKNARTTLTWAAIVFAILFIGIAYLVTTLGIIPDPERGADGPQPPRPSADRRRGRARGRPGGHRPHPRAGREHELRRLPAPVELPGARRVSPPPVRVPRRAARLHDRDRGAVAHGHRRCSSASTPACRASSRCTPSASSSPSPSRRAACSCAGGVDARPAGTRASSSTASAPPPRPSSRVVVGVSNFTEGAWLVIVLVPILMALLMAINRHYRDLAASLEIDHVPEAKEVSARPIVIVPIARLDRPALAAIAFANSISNEAVAVHVTNDPDAANELRKRWPSWASSTSLVVVESPYRALIGPLLAYMDALQKQAPERPIVVVLNEVVPRHWWENFLHNQTGLRLKLRLFSRPNTIVADVPYLPSARLIRSRSLDIRAYGCDPSPRALVAT